MSNIEKTTVTPDDLLLSPKSSRLARSAPGGEEAGAVTLRPVATARRRAAGRITLMVYIEAWDEFASASERLFLSAPSKVRRAPDGRVLRFPVTPSYLSRSATAALSAVLARRREHVRGDDACRRSA